MTHIAFIGAGSTVFAKNLIGDLLLYPEFANCTLTLNDIDPERLATSEIVVQKVAAATQTQPKIIATPDRPAALAGANFVIPMFEVGG